MHSIVWLFFSFSLLKYKSSIDQISLQDSQKTRSMLVYGENAVGATQVVSRAQPINQLIMAYHRYIIISIYAINIVRYYKKKKKRWFYVANAVKDACGNIYSISSESYCFRALLSIGTIKIDC